MKRIGVRRHLVLVQYIFKVYIALFNDSDSPNIYKEGRKNDCLILSHTADSASIHSLWECDAGAIVGFSPRSAILFPVISRCYEI